MAASVHNFILTYGELSIIKGLLWDSYRNAPDVNSANMTKALYDKIQEQQESGYPAKDYPFWRQYFDDTTDTTTSKQVS